MDTISLDFPPEQHGCILGRSGLEEANRSRLIQALDQHNLNRVFVYGTGVAGSYYSDVLGTRFAGFVDSNTLAPALRGAFDAILLAVSPVHCTDVMADLESCFGDDLTVVLPFSPLDFRVEVVVESMGGAASGGVIDFLMSKLDLNLANVHDAPLPNRYEKKGIIYYCDKPDRGFVMRSNNGKYLDDPDIRSSARMVSLLCYPFDSYYLVCFELARHYARGKYRDYRVESHSPEWKAVSRLIVHNVMWFDHIAQQSVVRYEDFKSDPAAAFAALSRIVGTTIEPGEMSFNHNPGRTYYQDCYEKYFDRRVYDTLKRAFLPAIRTYYPEKLDSLP